MSNFKDTLIISLFTGLLALLSIGLTSCNNDEVQMGCQTGILRGSGNDQRVYIRCCTEKQHLAGSNVEIGGSAVVSDYRNLQWTPIDKCENCK